MEEGGHGGLFVLFLKICIKGDGYYSRVEMGEVEERDLGKGSS